MYFPVILKTGETKLVNLANLKGITLGEVGPSLVESKPIRKVSFHSVRLDEADFSVDEESFQEGEFDKFCSALFANSLPKKFMDKKNKRKK